MNKYYDNLNEEIKEYFKILSPEFPEWLHEYIDTPEMERKLSIMNQLINNKRKEKQWTILLKEK